MSILEIRNVEYSYRTKYQTVNVLKGVSRTFERGKMYALVGKSGSGKSTLLSLMAGLMLPEQGEILFDGKSTAEMDLDLYKREKAAVIYQSFRLFPLLTVSENVSYPMELRGMKGKEARQKAAELVERVNLPPDVLDRFPEMLSGGEQQRVAIARAIGMNSGLLLADEPTGNLDQENTGNIIDLLSDLAHKDNYCVVIVTHDSEVAAKSDVTLKMVDGRLKEEI